MSTMTPIDIAIERGSSYMPTTFHFFANDNSEKLFRYVENDGLILGVHRAIPGPALTVIPFGTVNLSGVSLEAAADKWTINVFNRQTGAALDTIEIDFGAKRTTIQRAEGLVRSMASSNEYGALLSVVLVGPETTENAAAFA